MTYKFSQYREPKYHNIPKIISEQKWEKKKKSDLRRDCWSRTRKRGLYFGDKTGARCIVSVEQWQIYRKRRWEDAMSHWLHLFDFSPLFSEIKKSKIKEPGQENGDVLWRQNNWVGRGRYILQVRNQLCSRLLTQTTRPLPDKQRKIHLSKGTVRLFREEKNPEKLPPSNVRF